MHQDTASALSGLASFATLQDLLAARSQPDSAEATMTFEAFEVELGHAVRGLENELKAADLARYNVDADAVRVDGKAWRTCLENRPKTSLSASGPITVARNLYRPADGGKSIWPLELCAGISGGLYTPVLARQVSYLMGHMTSDETSTLFTELGIEGPSCSSCDRLPKLLSGVWEANREPWEEALRQQEVVPVEASVVAVSLDGVMVPDKDAQRAAKATREATTQQGVAKQRSGPAGYREVGYWWDTLTEAEQIDIAAIVGLLEAQGPYLSFPYSSAITNSRHQHMRELRIQHAGKPYRTLYAFDPRRVAVLLLGGDKTGDNRWYTRFVPQADRLYDEHLETLRREGYLDG